MSCRVVETGDRVSDERSLYLASALYSGQRAR